MKKLLLLFGIILLSTSIGFSQKKNRNKTVEPQHRVVYQLVASDTLSHQALIKQLNRLRSHWPSSTLEVVVHGFALDFMTTAKTVNYKGITDLMSKGIDFVVCENTMARMKVKKEQLIPGCRTVPMGIVEVIEKQEQGYSYIKAGE